jgi:two-component system chemotaxis response regulator CheB
VEKVKRLKPDAVTLDVEMPVMNGLEALKRIMAECPVPVIMLSSRTGNGTAETLQALELGAVDFVMKPSGPVSLDLHKIKQLLFEKLQIAVKTNVNKLALPPPPAVRQLSSVKRPDASPGPKPKADGACAVENLVAIGTSTGGPRALQHVLAQLPGDFPAPLVIVQHMPPRFTKSLADRLDSMCAIRVKEAAEGEELLNGCAYIAPGDWHMEVHQEEGIYRIRLTKDDPRGGHRPSVDTLFDSLVPLRELRRYAVLMTGMGGDGAKGMKALKESGARATIAESSETCVVYGMPRAAVELGGATEQLPLYKIASRLIEQVGRD